MCWCVGVLGLAGSELRIPEGLSEGLVFGEGLALHLIPQDTDVDENADWGPFGEKWECGEHFWFVMSLGLKSYAKPLYKRGLA